MNIKRKSIKANEELEVLEELIPESTCSYEECINHIHEAIDCLAECAKDDPIAKESIANLSVVLLDLQK